MSLATGTKLGPYEILAPLGAGGMGEVYRARDPKLNRDVAFALEAMSGSGAGTAAAQSATVRGRSRPRYAAMALIVMVVVAGVAAGAYLVGVASSMGLHSRRGALGRLTRCELAARSR